MFKVLEYHPVSFQVNMTLKLLYRIMILSIRTEFAYNMDLWQIELLLIALERRILCGIVRRVRKDDSGDITIRGNRKVIVV